MGCFKSKRKAEANANETIKESDQDLDDAETPAQPEDGTDPTSRANRK